MYTNVLSRVRQLRQTLKQHGNAEAVQDLLQQANVLMQMLLNQHVSIDFSSTCREKTLLAKIGELVQICKAIHEHDLNAQVTAQLQSILSACLSSSMCSATAKPNVSDAMSVHDKLQHVRSSLLSSLQT